ncbi:MAG: chemotaxis protein CheW [Leptospiraceae bacterium]|nr:chemotaxis protein CheW [Leptospiraceae bacterium]
MAVSAEVTAFLEDLFENLGVIDAALSRIEDTTASEEQLHEIFRAAHTIKGNAAMMNLTQLVALGHALETALQEIISGNVAIDRQALNLFRECSHAMQQTGEALRSGQDPSTIEIRNLTDRIQVLLLSQRRATVMAGDGEAGERDVEVSLHIARAELAPSVRAFLVETKLAEIGEIIRKTPNEEEIESPAFMASSRLLTFMLRTRASATEIRDNLNIDLIEDISILETKPQRAETSPQVERQKQEVAAEVHTSSADTVRLPVSTLDRLMNLTGELVVANSGLAEIADTLATQDDIAHAAMRLTDKNREILRITADIQHIVMQSRMLPLEHVFSRFRRFVRDYLEKTGKSIRLDVSGAETELDKRVIDEIIKPLTHLIRNSLDHGFENPEERVAAGKAAEGRLRLGAVQAGSSILITVEDDGRGLNLEKILARAVEKNLVSAERAASLTASEIQEFIFMPGFSTKESADDLSGRGFGMDIVRDSIRKLSGDLTITTQPGQGTRMQVRLPLTLAIMTTLTFRVRNDVFALPLTVIEETLRVTAGSVLRIDGREVLHSRDRVIPYLRLDAILGYPAIEENDADSFAIIAENHGRKYALGMDAFLKKHELVVKSLAENYHHVPGLAGAAMLGNDEIVFIIDLEQLIRLYDAPEVMSSEETPAETVMAAKRKVTTKPETSAQTTDSTADAPQPAGLQPMFHSANKDLVRRWISQSNKAAVKGMQMLTGNSAVAVKKSRGALVKPEKSRNAIERILKRAGEIYLIHLPMLPAAGAIDLILGKEGAHRMSKILFAAAGLNNEGEFDPSPLLEITNILGSAYTNTLTFLTETSVEPATPTLLSTPAEIQSLVDHRLLAPKTELLVIENQFHIADEDIEIELMIYLEGG